MIKIFYLLFYNNSGRKDSFLFLDLEFSRINRLILLMITNS
ncbi:hypothetical protein CM318V1_210231 [Carnobacterium maltaromaticum]|nr:hypothetical protein CM318V1_210231 [Carnobacterium maltaromaticum]